jgi:LAGLIDADG endonuclease.
VFLRTSVQTSFRIEVKQNYSREVVLEQGGSSFFHIMSEISNFLTVNLYTRTRKTKDKVFYAFAVVAHNTRSHEILHEYFSRFPLYSSKFLAYKD